MTREAGYRACVERKLPPQSQIAGVREPAPQRLRERYRKLAVSLPQSRLRRDSADVSPEGRNSDITRPKGDDAPQSEGALFFFASPCGPKNATGIFRGFFLKGLLTSRTAHVIIVTNKRGARSPVVFHPSLPLFSTTESVTFPLSSPPNHRPRRPRLRPYASRGEVSSRNPINPPFPRRVPATLHTCGCLFCRSITSP